MSRAIAANMFDLDRIGGARAWQDLLSTILRAGEMALAMQRQVRVEQKHDESPVTAADRAVEEALVEHLRRRWPQAHILGEEGGPQGAPEGGLRFIIDPIDGTRAFIRNLPTWSVLVGMLWDDEVVGGVAFMPAAGDFFSAVAGHGAYANGRPCRVSSTATLGESLVTFGGLRQFTGVGEDARLLRVAKASYTTRAFADFANYAALLRGQVDAVVDPDIRAWDVAPADILVREAGGRFGHWDGTPGIQLSRSANEGTHFVASNGAIHDELTTLLA